MEPVTVFISTILIGLFFYYLLKPVQRPKNFPPGPNGIPLFGSAFQVGGEGHKFGIKMEPIYGPIIGVKTGSYWAVIINNADDIREAYNKAEFSGRSGYHPIIEDNISSNTKGVILSQGPYWQEFRRFSLKTLREFGFGKRSIEPLILEEVQELIEKKFKPYLGKPIVNFQLFNASALNVIWALVGGQRYSLDDERLGELINFISENFSTSFDGLKLLNVMFPAVVKFRNLLPFDLPDSTRPGLRKLLAFLTKTVAEHRQTIQIGSPRDFIDVFIEDRHNKANSKSNSDEDDIDLAYTLLDLFAAGSDTTSTTLSWTLFLLASHPKTQEKLYQEIHSLAGNRPVGLEDRVKMPYTEAVMLEVHRMASLVPTSVPHSTTEDVEFKGYKIPKNTIIVANLYNCHFSKATWGDPQNFRPERFLSADEKTFTRHPNVMAFSVGKRQCLGETTAKDEFFLFLTNIIQQLKVEFPMDEPKHSLEGQMGLVVTPEPHRIVFTNRL